MLNRRLGASKDRSGCLEKRNISCFSQKFNISSVIQPLNLVTILTTLSCLLPYKDNTN
jgi:hypothetical protein